MRSSFFRIAVVLVLTRTIAVAGGTSFEAEILELKPKGTDEFRMVLMQFEKPYSARKPIKPRKLIIHLRYLRRAFQSPKDVACVPKASKEDYSQAVEILKTQFQKGGRFRFGIGGIGYTAIREKPGEYQSNGLLYTKEHSGEMVVYSFESCL